MYFYVTFEEAHFLIILFLNNKIIINELYQWRRAFKFVQVARILTALVQFECSAHYYLISWQLIEKQVRIICQGWDTSHSRKVCGLSSFYAYTYTHTHTSQLQPLGYACNNSTYHVNDANCITICLNA